MHGRGLNRFHGVSRFMANTPAAAKKSMSIVRRTKSSAGTDLAAAHAEIFTVLVSRVTAPLRASALPVKPAPVVIVMVVRAMMFPENVLPVPSVAELPTCQKRFGGQVVPPVLVRTTDDALAVVTVEPPRTAKLPAVPRLGCANADEEMERNAAIPRIARRPRSFRVMLNLLFVNGGFGFTV